MTSVLSWSKLHLAPERVVQHPIHIQHLHTQPPPPSSTLPPSLSPHPHSHSHPHLLSLFHPLPQLLHLDVLLPIMRPPPHPPQYPLSQSDGQCPGQPGAVDGGDEEEATGSDEVGQGASEGAAGLWTCSMTSREQTDVVGGWGVVRGGGGDGGWEEVRGRECEEELFGSEVVVGEVL